MADVVVARERELLREIARLAEDGPPVGLASSDPKLFERWRAATKGLFERSAHFSVVLLSITFVLLFSRRI